MLDAPIPTDEALRLADLQSLGILDTPSEERFDRITQAAQRLFRVPIALVSLIDSERQWFKSRQGLCELETARNISFCGHAIHCNHPFVVPNACEDERFADNPLVTGDFHLRFYAGVALRSTNGRPLGTLCLIDRQPKTMTPEELMLLTDLAAWAERELNLRELQVANDLAELCSRRLRVVLDSTADAVIAVDEQLVIHTLNRTASQMFALTEAEWLGQSLRRLLPESAIETVLAGLQELQREHKLHTALPSGLALSNRDDTPFNADIRIGRMEIRGSSCFTLIIRDVTAQRELDKMKSAFVATVSHELRTPLTAIHGAISILAAGIRQSASEAQQRLLDVANENCTRLAGLVSDILDLDRMDHGRLSLRIERQPLLPLLEHALLLNETYATPRGIHLRLIALHESPWVDVDADRLQQVMANLLSNAIKFSPHGGEVRVRLETKEDDVLVSVEDDGTGIPADFQARVFERFSQSESVETRSKGGSGLGLSIAKGLAEAHGGHLSFFSTEGKGTHFYLRLKAGAQNRWVEERPANPARVSASTQ